MVEEYKLQMHLKLLRSVYMMEAGHVLNRFYEILFYEVKNIYHFHIYIYKYVFSFI